jgi:peptidoglycan/xylan/chitin deacetylase (PgdA/CDA1 family)
MTTISILDLGHKLSDLEKALWKILGVKPALYRPAHGSYNEVTLNFLNQRGYTVVGWDFDTADSVGGTPDESKRRIDDVVQRHPSNILILAHETYQTTAHDVVPYALQKLHGLGYKQVTMCQCLNVEPYQSHRGSYEEWDDTWFC